MAKRSARQKEYRDLVTVALALLCIYIVFFLTVAR